MIPDIQNNQSSKGTKYLGGGIHENLSFSPRRRWGCILLYPKAEEAIRKASNLKQDQQLVDSDMNNPEKQWIAHTMESKAGWEKG